MPKLNKLWFEYIDDNKKLMTFEPTHKLTGMCCAFNKVMGRLKTESLRYCRPEHVDYFLKFVNGFVSDVMDIFCGQSTPGSANCRAVEVKLDSIRLAKGSHQYMTAIPVMIEVLKSF